jgi:hypothetical protein
MPGEESALADGEEVKKEGDNQRLDLLLESRMLPVWIPMFKDAAQANGLSTVQMAKKLMLRNRDSRLVSEASLEPENLFTPPYGGWDEHKVYAQLTTDSSNPYCRINYAHTISPS